MFRVYRRGIKSLIAPLKDSYTPGEKMIHEKLANTLEASKLSVADISGGCGSMYAIEITSKRFVGLSLLKQHRVVSDLLKDEIKAMHGIQIKTHPE
jgi:stress-induced morphogen